MYVHTRTRLATKTISLDIEAYEQLRGARTRPDESFSQVIKRAEWRPAKSTAAELLRVIEGAPTVPARVLARGSRAGRDDGTGVVSAGEGDPRDHRAGP